MKIYEKMCYIFSFSLVFRHDLTDALILPVSQLQTLPPPKWPILCRVGR